MQMVSSLQLLEDKGGQKSGQLLVEAVESILEGEEERCSLLQYGMGAHFEVIIIYLKLCFYSSV